MKSLLHFIEADYSRHHIPSVFKCFGPYSQERDEESGVSQHPEIFLHEDDLIDQTLLTKKTNLVE